MGLKYHDTNEFFEAVKRDDALAVELFIQGRGVNLGAKDAQGARARKGRATLEEPRGRDEPVSLRVTPAARGPPRPSESTGAPRW